jgi:hypothetical protein
MTVWVFGLPAINQQLRHDRAQPAAASASSTRGGRCRTPGLRQAQVEGRSRSVRGIIWDAGSCGPDTRPSAIDIPKSGSCQIAVLPRLRRHRVLCGPPPAGRVEAAAAICPPLPGC